MRVRRTVIISIAAVLLVSLAAILLFVLKTKSETESFCKKVLLLDSKVVLPSRYCLEFENETIDSGLLDELIESLCAETDALMTESLAANYREVIATSMHEQADKKYTVSSKTRAYQKLVGFRLKSADEVEIRAEVKRNSTEFAVIEGRLSQFKQAGSDVFLYTFRLKKESGVWKVDSIQWLQQEIN